MKNDIIPPKLPRPVNPAPSRLPPPGATRPSLPLSAPARPLQSPASPPMRPTVQSTPPVQLITPQTPSSQPTPTLPSPVPPEQPQSEHLEPTRKLPHLSFKLFLLSVVVILLLAVAAAGLWYVVALGPVAPKDTSRERITIKPGSSLSTIGDVLEQKHLIRNPLAFTIYARLSGASARLQAGTYSLSPSESTKAIIAHFVSGNVDQFSVTFLPGATLRRLPGETSASRTDVESVLLKAGYSQDEIETAFAKTYNHPLFTDKPSTADLEGYIYGETYKFSSNTSVEQILEKTFDEYYSVIEKNNLIAGFKAQGLSLYQGITLASIVQREVTSPADQKQVAQVFLTRLKSGMPLGSDVTFQYAAKKANVPALPTLDSPYNTRVVTGLPPGPISTPGLTALQAVANPAPGDYLYFLSGDDGVTYFARTDAEHQANIAAHCREKCSGA